MLDANDPRLTAYVLGELSEADRATVEAALAVSPELRREVDALRNSTERLARHFAAESPLELSAEQREAIERSARADNRPACQPASSLAATNNCTPSHKLSIAVVACSLLLVIGISTWATLGDVWRTSRQAATAPDDATSTTAPVTIASPAGESSATIALDPSGRPTTDFDLSLEDQEFDSGGMRQHGGFANPNRSNPQGFGPSEYGAYGDSVYGAGQASSGAYPSPLSLPHENSTERNGNDDHPFYADNPTEAVVEESLRMAVTELDSAPAARPSVDDFSEMAVPTNDSPIADPVTEPGLEGRNSPASSASIRLYNGQSLSDESAPAAREEREPGDQFQRPSDGYSLDEAGQGQQSSSESSIGLSRNGDGASAPRRQLSEVEDLTKLADTTGQRRELRDLESEQKGKSSQTTSGKSSGEWDRKSGENKPATMTWRRARATPNNSRLMIGDHDDLPLEGIQANVVIDGFRARVLLDCYYFNDRGQQLEGSFQLRLPNEASLYYFAFGQTSFEYRPRVDQLASRGFLSAELVRATGTGPREILEARRDTWTDVKEARLVPPQKAAYAYSEVVRRRVDPALVEWAGAGVFNAKVFPLMPNKLHRVVIGYDVNLTQDGDDLVYRFEMPDDIKERMVDLDVSALPGTQADVPPETRPFISAGRAFYHFKNPESSAIEVRFQQPGNSLLVGQDEEAGRFFATRVTPPLDDQATETGSSHAVFLLDTSLSANPDKFNAYLKLLEASLRENGQHMKHFAVLFFNVETHWWQGQYVDNTEENVAKLIADCEQLALEGATDLQAAIAEAAAPRWLRVGGKMPRPDLFLLSDGAVTWGETSAAQMISTLEQASVGSLFAFNTGLTGTDTALLDQLTSATGGAVFTVANEDEIKKAATAHRRRPWQLLSATIDGGNDVLIAGRPRSIFPGQSLLLVGRGGADAELTPAVNLQLRRGEETKTVTILLDRTIQSELAPRLYGQVAVGQLELLADATESIATAYARHFRVTGRSVSLLMLESEADYQRFDIKPEDDVLVVETTSARDVVERKLDEWNARLADPKDTTLRWLRSLEKMPGMSFTIPPALGPALDQLSQQAFTVTVAPLDCQQRTRAALPKEYVALLSQTPLNYETVVNEAERRRRELGWTDALKALSSLIEQQPGDPVLARDVAFTAIGWGAPGRAYPLLRRVAVARPYEPQVYQAIAHCLSQTGNADLAMVYYEIVLNGQWNDRYPDVQQIVAMEYMYLLRRIDGGELSSELPQYAKSRLKSLVDRYQPPSADMVVTMMWNTDRTDVDLHVVEPSGEVCFYQHTQTASGGRITRDVTQGFGPEMYTLPKAPAGTYRIQANYYGSDANRTQARTKVYVTIYENFGQTNEQVTRKTVTLQRTDDKQDLATVNVKRS